MPSAMTAHVHESAITKGVPASQHTWRDRVPKAIALGGAALVVFLADHAFGDDLTLLSEVTPEVALLGALLGVLYQWRRRARGTARRGGRAGRAARSGPSPRASAR